MPERLIDLTDQQLEILRILLKGGNRVTEFETSMAGHLTILHRHGLVELYHGQGDRISTRLTTEGARLAVTASIRFKNSGRQTM